MALAVSHKCAGKRTSAADDKILASVRNTARAGQLYGVIADEALKAGNMLRARVAYNAHVEMLRYVCINVCV